MVVDLPPEIVITAPVTSSQRESEHRVVYGPVLERSSKASAGQCEQSSSDEIVVCAEVDNEQFRVRPLPPMPPSKTMTEEVIDALSIERGNIVLGLIAPGQVGIKIKF